MSVGLDDHKRFEMMAGHVRTIAETLLTEFFGPRCSDLEPGCPNCERWQALDDLTDNPFGENAEGA